MESSMLERMVQSLVGNAQASEPRAYDPRKGDVGFPQPIRTPPEPPAPRAIGQERLESTMRNPDIQMMLWSRILTELMRRGVQDSDSPPIGINTLVSGPRHVQPPLSPDAGSLLGFGMTDQGVQPPPTREPFLQSPTWSDRWKAFRMPPEWNLNSRGRLP